MTASASPDAAPPPSPDLTDEELAGALAHAAGIDLLELRTQGLTGKDLKDAGDRRSHELLMAALAECRPGDAVLSEEGANDANRVGAQRVWIIDPLDGTREYSELDRSDWAVHVALWEDGELSVGAVGRPAAGVLHTTADPGTVKADSATVRLAVSRSRPPEFVAGLAGQLEADLVPMGSAGVKAMSVVTGESDAYVHAGGQYEWDSAAPVAVARAAGLHTSRIDGSALEYNRADPWLPDLIICRPELTDRILAALS